MTVSYTPIDGHGTPAYRGYVLATLLTVFTFEVMDRILFGMVQEGIKSDLILSDFQLGLLGGPAFVVLNALAALPIAYMADRSNRVTIVSLGVGFWSLATALCGAATSFLQLAGLRTLVGVGGAACLPPSHSLIADYFPAKKRASALAIFGLAIPIGSFVAAIFGGWVASQYGWRAAFLAFGIPGVVVGLIVKLTVKEPPRAEVVSFDNPLIALKELLGKRSFVHLTIGSSVLGFFTFSSQQFIISFMMRNYSVGVEVAAMYFGIVIMGATGAGIFLGGFIADRLRVENPRAIVSVPLIGILASIPFFFLAVSQDALIPMVILYSIASLFIFLYLSPTFAALQGMAGPKRRASATALYLMVSTLIGYGMGPPLIGWIADRAREKYLLATDFTAEQCDLSPQLVECAAAGGHGLKIALMIGLVFLAWSSIHFWIASRHIQNELVD
jgi:MFS family permease